MTVRLPQEIEKTTELSLSAGLNKLATELRKLQNAPVPGNAPPAGMLHRLEAAVQPVDIFRWLQTAAAGKRVYWSERDGSFESAGLGEADVVSFTEACDFRELFRRLRRYSPGADNDFRYYGGIRFNPAQQADCDWQPFASCRFTLPEIELFQENGNYRVACNLKLKPDNSPQDTIGRLLNKIQALRQHSNSSPSKLPAILGRVDAPSPEQWTVGIETALRAFREKRLQKVVLARKSSFLFAEKPNPLSILEKLRAPAQNLFNFYFQPDPDHIYMGASPERLYFRRHNTVLSEAIAGTRPRSESTRKDLMWGAELQNCEKDVREHRYVVDYLRDAFQQFCRYYTCDDAPRLLKLTKVQHLFTGFEGQLKPDVCDDLLLSLLHPTPAVGGLPKQAAIKMVAALEPFDRGWYTGPVGWVGKDSASFAVAIRSGLVVKNNLHLFSGAGIVEGSQPRSEWEEIENKISNFLKVIDAE